MGFESVTDMLLLAGVGLAAGFINVMAGGGSLLTLPAMVLLGLPGPVANGTNRVALLAQNIAATATFVRKGYSDFKLSLTLALCTLPGVVVGALAATRFGGVWFNRVLAGVMIVVMIVMARGRRPAEVVIPAAPPSRRRLVGVHLCMVLFGFYGGFIQAGLGFLIIALLHRGLRLDLVRVNMHKVFIVGFYTVVALGIFIANGKVHWGAGLVLAAGTSAGAWLSTHVAIGRGERVIRVVLYAALVVMAVKLFLG